MTKTPKEEAEVLLNYLVPFAEQQLQKRGEFDIKELFIKRAKNGEYKATGFAYMVTLTEPDSGEKSDAVCVNLDHLENYSVKVIYPYKLTKKLFRKNKVEFFEPRSAPGEDKIF